MSELSIKTLYYICDTVLELFDEAPSGIIENDLLFRKASMLPRYEDEVLSFLVSEGLLEQRSGSFKITYKGRVVIQNGGFKKRLQRDRILRACAITAAIASVLAIILQVLFYFLG